MDTPALQQTWLLMSLKEILRDLSLKLDILTHFISLFFKAQLKTYFIKGVV